MPWGVSYSPPASSSRNLNNVQMWRVHRYHCISVATMTICLLSHRSHHLIILVFLMILSLGADGRSVICVTDYAWVGRDDQKVLVAFLSGSLNYMLIILYVADLRQLLIIMCLHAGFCLICFRILYIECTMLIAGMVMLSLERLYKETNKIFLT